MSDDPPYFDRGTLDMDVELDIETLGTFYEMAREGAGLSADRLTRMAGVATRVGVTRLNFMRGRDLQAALSAGGQKAGIVVGLTGGFEGDSLIVYDAASAQSLVDELLTDVPVDGVDDIAESALLEVSQVMTSGFIDGWAEVLDVPIDLQAPEYVSGTSATPFMNAVRTVPTDDELALLFQNRIETVDENIAFDHYFFPSGSATQLLFGKRETEGIALRKLIGFNHMAERGADEVANNLTTMTGIEMDVRIRRVNFRSLDTIPEEVPNERLISVAFKFDGIPSGYLVFVYDATAAHTLVEATLPSADPEEISAMGQDAISEFSNVMASGFLDGWANVLGTTIDHTTPRYVEDLGPAVVDPLVTSLSRRQEFAFVYDTRIEATGAAFDVSVYVVPDEQSLYEALESIDTSRVVKEPTKATYDYHDVEADPAAITELEDDK